MWFRHRSSTFCFHLLNYMSRKSYVVLLSSGSKNQTLARSGWTSMKAVKRLYRSFFLLTLSLTKLFIQLISILLRRDSIPQSRKKILHWTVKAKKLLRSSHLYAISFTIISFTALKQTSLHKRLKQDLKKTRCMIASRTIKITLCFTTTQWSFSKA